MDLFHLFKIFIKISEIYWQFSYFDHIKKFLIEIFRFKIFKRRFFMKI